LSYYYNNIVAEMLYEFFTAVFISESKPRILCIRQIRITVSRIDIRNGSLICKTISCAARRTWELSRHPPE